MDKWLAVIVFVVIILTAPIWASLVIIWWEWLGDKLS